MDNNTQEQIRDLQTQVAALLQRVEELEDREDGIANFETITCRQLLVVDANDRPRIEAAVDEEDTANLFLRDQSGMQRIISSATVMWCDATGAARVTAGTHADGDASLAMQDTNENIRMIAMDNSDGECSVQLIDADENIRIVAKTNALGNADIQCFDQQNNVRLICVNDVDGEVGLLWLDAAGNPRIDASTSSDGTVTLPIKDVEQGE